MKRIIEKNMYKCPRCGKLETVANHEDEYNYGSNGMCGCEYFAKDGSGTTGIFHETIKVNISKEIGEKFADLIDNYVFVDESNMSVGALEIRQKIIDLCQNNLYVDIFEKEPECEDLVNLSERMKEHETPRSDCKWMTCVDCHRFDMNNFYICKQQKNNRCSYCNKVTDFPPVVCEKCNKKFCSDHEPAEKHNCENIEDQCAIKYDVSTCKLSGIAICGLCKETINHIPFECKRCGEIFCDDHRLPENHCCNGEGYYNGTLEK